jgi:hypothetical protein
MLTHNDVTVDNALDVFDSCKDLPVKFWGQGIELLETLGWDA